MTILSGKRILIIEDEAILAMTAEDILFEVEAEAVGPATTLEQAKKLAQSERIDAALVDLNLNGLPSYAVAEILAQRMIPFIFVTGYETANDENWAHIKVLHKPYQQEQLVESLVTALQRSPNPTTC